MGENVNKQNLEHLISFFKNARMIRVWLKSDSVSQQPSTCQPYGLVWNVEGEIF